MERARAGHARKVARATLQKIEKGCPGCRIVMVFELAASVGVMLFERKSPGRARHHECVHDKLAALPKAVRSMAAVAYDGF